MKNKAFTLVELLGVIVLLGILSIVIIPKIGDSLQNSKETALLTQEEQIKKAALDFLIEHTELLDENDTIALKLGTLKQGGYLPIKLKNPKTRKNLSNESTITITKNGNNYDIKLNLIDLENATENIDSNSPILVLNGNYIEYLEVNDEYIEKGATAMTSTGEEIDEGDISIQVLYNDEETTLTTTELKTYSIVYTVTDDEGRSTSATRTVIVRDSTAPTIIIPKDTNIHVSEIASFNNQRGVIIADNYDANPTLTIDSTLANIPGTYVITYTVTDSSGNQTTERRVINVNNDIHESHEIAYQINGKTTSSSSEEPTMENPVTYYGLGQNNQINVTTTGKNMFDKSKYLRLEDYTSHNSASSYDYKKIPLKPNTTYKISVIRYNNFDGTGNGYLLISDNKGINYNYSAIAHRTYPNYGGLNSFTYTTKDDGLLYIGLLYTTQADLDTIWANTDVQIEEGTTATDFEPYKGRTTTIDMTGHNPLMCLGDNCDYIDYANNRIVRNVGKYIVTGNEEWTWRNTTETGISTYSLVTVNMPFDYKYHENTKAFNNYLKYNGTTISISENYYSSKYFTLYYNTNALNSRAIYVNSSTISTQADFKSNLQTLYNNGNPMIIYYELPESTYEPITLPPLSKYYDDYYIIAYDEYGAVEVTY